MQIYRFGELVKCNCGKPGCVTEDNRVSILSFLEKDDFLKLINIYTYEEGVRIQDYCQRERKTDKYVLYPDDRHAFLDKFTKSNIVKQTSFIFKDNNNIDISILYNKIPTFDLNSVSSEEILEITEANIRNYKEIKSDPIADAKRLKNIVAINYKKFAKRKPCKKQHIK